MPFVVNPKQHLDVQGVRTKLVPGRSCRALYELTKHGCPPPHPLSYGSHLPLPLTSATPSGSSNVGRFVWYIFRGSSDIAGKYSHDKSWYISVIFPLTELMYNPISRSQSLCLHGTDNSKKKKKSVHKSTKKRSLHGTRPYITPHDEHQTQASNLSYSQLSRLRNLYTATT